MVARKKKAKVSKGLVVRSVGTSVSQNTRDRFADTMAKHKSKAPNISSNDWLTTTATGFMYGENNLGAEIEVVIIDHAYMNSFYGYDAEYDPDNITPPICVAVNEVQGDLQPDEKSSDRQSEDCESCDWNKFSSASKGKGKACKNYIRIAIIHTYDITSDVMPKVLYTKLPPSAIASYADYVNQVHNVLLIPTLAVVTKLSIVPAKVAYTVETEMLGVIEDDSALDKLSALYDSVHSTLLSLPDLDAEVEAPTPRKSGKKKAVGKKKVVSKKQATSKKKVGARKAKY